MDASQARVRVSPSRFKKLKKVIANCDREIQELDLKAELEKVAKGFYPSQPLEKILAKRRKLDQARKAARLKMKGYA